MSPIMLCDWENSKGVMKFFFFGWNKMSFFFLLQNKICVYDKDLEKYWQKIFGCVFFETESHHFLICSLSHNVWYGVPTRDILIKFHKSMGSYKRY
jgi:hypothetical protein